MILFRCWSSYLASGTRNVWKKLKKTSIFIQDLLGFKKKYSKFVTNLVSSGFIAASFVDNKMSVTLYFNDSVHFRQWLWKTEEVKFLNTCLARHRIHIGYLKMIKYLPKILFEFHSLDFVQFCFDLLKTFPCLFLFPGWRRYIKIWRFFA